LSTLCSDSRVGVLRVAHVGLPLAVAFGRRYDTIDYDLSADRVKAYRPMRDLTGEVGGPALRPAGRVATEIRASGRRVWQL
jgi:UDP-N-acetyl-D-galactosamine dehydrogenase